MIQGRWYEKGSATSYKAIFQDIDNIYYKIELDNGRNLKGLIEALSVGNRLGNVERKIILEDGSLFATKENDKVDELLKNKLKINHFIHTLETHIRWVVVALVVTVLFSFSFFKWGIPYASKQIAHALPHKTNQLIASNTLDYLDKYIFNKSTLSIQEMNKIRVHFKTNLVPLSIEDKSITYTLHFRDWSDVPNALALPSGDIILTDKFVELCKSQEEMDAVLLHEMGHIVHRHSLEMVIQSTFVSVAVMLIVGDSNGLADMGVGLGSLMVSSAYSRGHETEADLYAFEHMLTANMNPKAFSRIMNRMTEYIQSDKSITKHKPETKNSEDSILDYLSSHPSTKKRVEIANMFAECYRKGLKSCKIELMD